MTEQIGQSAADCRQDIGLSDLQRKVVANGMTARAGLLILAFVALAVYLVAKMLGYLSPALMPVIVGAFMAMICKPLYTSGVAAAKTPWRRRVVIWYNTALISQQL